MSTGTASTGCSSCRVLADDRREPGAHRARRAEEQAEQAGPDGQDDHRHRHERAATRAGGGSLVVQRFLPWNVMKNRRDM